MSMESSVFWGNTSHWGVTDAGVLLVVSMASGAGGHFFVLMHVSVKKKRVGWLGAGAGWGQHWGGAGCFLGCSALAGLWGCEAAGAGAVEVAPVPGARPHSLIPLVRDVPDAARIRTLGMAEFLPSREMGALQRSH